MMSIHYILYVVLCKRVSSNVLKRCALSWWVFDLQGVMTSTTTTTTMTILANKHSYAHRIRLNQKIEKKKRTGKRFPFKMQISPIFVSNEKSKLKVSSVWTFFLFFYYFIFPFSIIFNILYAFCFTPYNRINSKWFFVCFVVYA